METLIKAASDLLASILGRIGFVGRPRRRTAIRQDLELLRDLETSPLSAGNWAHDALLERITLDIAEYAGVDLPRRKIQWGSVVVASAIGVPVGYWTYWLNSDAFEWWSLLPGAVAGLMAIAILGLITSPEEHIPDNPPAALAQPTATSSGANSDDGPIVSTTN